MAKGASRMYDPAPAARTPGPASDGIDRRPERSVDPQMSELPSCPECKGSYTYEDRSLFVCPECGHEWTGGEEAISGEQLIVKDANGAFLEQGDSVTVIKDLKVKGSSAVVKVGTKVKNIRLVDGDHNIDCKIERIGAMKLKSEFVRKA